MNEQTISEKFTRVDAALDRIRIKTNTENEPIENVAAAVESLGPVQVQLEPGYVTFYDYDGTILFSYTKEEIEELSELPIPPEKDGLIFDGWNWTLQEIKNENKKVNVGAMYTGDGYDVRIDFRIDAEYEKYVSLNLRWVNIITVDWGDGTSDSYDYYSMSITSNFWTQVYHIYSSPGNYSIKVDTSQASNVVIGGQQIFNYGNDYKVSDIYLGDVEVPNQEYLSFGGSLYNLRNFVMSNSTKITATTSTQSTNIYFMYQNTGLRHLNIPRSTRKLVGLYKTALRTISLPGNLQSLEYDTLRESHNLTSLIIPDSVTSISSRLYQSGITEYIPSRSAAFKGFQYCYNVTEFKPFSNITSFTSSMFENLYRSYFMDFTDYSVIPTIEANTFNNVRTYFIVKDSLVDSWKEATNWSAYADKIIGESDWNSNPRPYIEPQN